MKVAAAVILADEGVPERLARPGHPHGQIEQAERRGLFGVGFQQVFVAAHPRIVVDIAGPGRAHRRMNEQIGLGLLNGAQGQFLMGAVHRVASLEGDYPSPAQLDKAVAQFARRVAPLWEIVMRGRLDAV